MAARRLLVAMLVMLAISMVAAALVPRPQPAPDAGSTSTSAEATKAGGGGRFVRASINTGDRRARTVRLRVGDQLALRVVSSRDHLIELHGLGETESVARLAPARFDLLATRPGTYPVRLVEGGSIGRIVVARGRGTGTDRKPPTGERGSGRGR